MRILCTLPLGLSLFLAPVLASPVVNVGLKASWNSPPFLLELLETAAEETPSSYWPLIDKIAEGAFAQLATKDDKSLYNEFLRIANEAGFLRRPEERSSFDLALSIHSASPRIEAHYHHYVNNQEPRMGSMYYPTCAVWMQWASKQYCELDDSFKDMVNGIERYPNDKKKIQIDHVMETKEDLPAAILHADILAPEFADHHKRLKKHAQEGYVSYRLRYKPPLVREERPVMLSGYGVELVLKKTDYMVVDDRDVEETAKIEATTPEQQVLGQLDDAEVHDIKPLSKAELSGLGHKAATFVMGSEKPLEMLLRLLQDFPKHAAAVAAVEPEADVVEEFLRNWDFSLGSGKNIIWINGVQIEPSQVNSFALLDYLRKERRYIDGFGALGLNSSEAIGLLSHSSINEAKVNENTQRFDYRDELEGGEVLLWLNNLEKDSRYNDWSPSLQVLLRRVYPGQLHPLRKNLHQLVLPIDFTDSKDLELIKENLMMFVQRKIAMRFALVPLLKTKQAVESAKVIYHLLDVYGLKSVLKFIEVQLAQKEFAKPTEKVFKAVIGASTLKDDKTPLSFTEVLKNEDLEQRIKSVESYSSRLGLNAPTPPIFMNGQVLPKSDDWANMLSNKLPGDVTKAQRHVYELAAEDRLDDDDIDLTAYLLEGAATRRNAYIFPEAETDIKLINVAELQEAGKSIIPLLPQLEAEGLDVPADTSVWVVGDFDEPDGYELLVGAALLHKETPGVGLVLINNPQVLTEKPTLSTLLFHLQEARVLTAETLAKLLEELKPAEKTLEVEEMPAFDTVAKGFSTFAKEDTWSYPDHLAAGKFWREAQGLLKPAGFTPGQRGIIVNGRVVGPIKQTDRFIRQDFEQLISYEHDKRIKALVEAANDLGLKERITGGSLGWAAVTNQVALASISEIPPGLVEVPDTTRINVLRKFDLNGKHSALYAGDFEKATIQIVASINPASELAQKWVPLLQVLSEMTGVGLKIFLNPSKMVTELPVKRFYRHVLNAKPVFDEAGNTIEPRARFEHLPEKPLLSFSIDVPPSWLVNPVDSVYDLDNLMLESLKDRLNGRDVTALYELSSILIEGHARDITTGTAPRGAQVILGTKKDPMVADTIVMANLNYFQFKANPGLWKMALKNGRTREIFHLDSVGTKGFRALDAEEDPEIGVTSFLGATLFPRLSRRLGQEDADVLEPATVHDSFMDKAKATWNIIYELMSDYGGLNKEPEIIEPPQADINIFSVASGHLYERFLGIMIASTMKHTNHTVKFWLIENYLSPSFKNFLPVLAKEYGFDYQLVTYKWPHWLRAQTEKQREIWGYKILFLDVLFPLSLDKVIFVDADQIVRTDLYDLVTTDLHGAPYGFTPMGDSREEIEGFRFWKQGYWKQFLAGRPYHISALYVVDLVKFRAIAAGDRLRQQYHQLSADPGSLANLDQDLPNHMQSQIKIHSLEKEWLWCETWCADEELENAKTIDLCNNPMTKEPKLDRARRQVPEWRGLDEEVTALREGRKKEEEKGEGKEEGKGEGKDEL